MKSRNALIGLAGMLIISAGTANAQGLSLPWDDLSPLTAEDRAMIGDGVQQHIHSQYLTMEPGSRQVHGRYAFTSCQLSDGTWKLSE